MHAEEFKLLKVGHKLIHTTGQEATILAIEEDGVVVIRDHALRKANPTKNSWKNLKLSWRRAPKVVYPTYSVRNPWVDFAKESMSKYFPVSHEGLEAAIQYCSAHKLSGVVFLKDARSVEDVWDNPAFNQPSS